ncbi:DNA glycosylase, partial [Microdochium bolleyi]
MRTTPGSPAANAAVDTMGCERLALATDSPRDQRFQTLIALMLSSQTKDTTNAVAMRRLQTELPTAAAAAAAPSASTEPPPPPPAGYQPPTPGLNLENILAVDPDTLNNLIWAVGFHNNKTKYIKAAALIIRDTWGGEIPDTFAGLVSLPGVGPKMAHLCLSAAWGRTEGIGVDVHVHRISNMWGWTSSGGRKPTKTPEDTRKALESWLPRDKWRDINWLLVGLGQTVCGPVTKRCGDCAIGLAGLCRAADRGKINAARRASSGGVKKEEEAEVAAAGEMVDIKSDETPFIMKREAAGSPDPAEGIATPGTKIEDERGTVKREEAEAPEVEIK